MLSRPEAEAEGEIEANNADSGKEDPKTNFLPGVVLDGSKLSAEALAASLTGLAISLSNRSFSKKGISPLLSDLVNILRLFGLSFERGEGDTAERMKDRSLGGC